MQRHAKAKIESSILKMANKYDFSERRRSEGRERNHLA